MSGSQKVLKLFAVFELLMSAYYAYLGIAGENVTSLVSASLYLLTSVMLFTAAKDAKKAGGAWLITLADVIMSAAELLFALNGGADGGFVIACIVAVVLNLIAFIAANNVKRQGKK